MVQGAGKDSECDFENLTKENRSKVTRHMDVKYLNAADIDPSKDYIIQSGYKTGKSRLMHDYAKQDNRAVLHIVNLRSSRDGVMEKFADCGVLSYENKTKFNEEFTPGRSVVVTLDSLMMLEKVDFRAEDYVVYLDEIHSIKVYLASSTTLAANRAQIWSLFGRITKNCKQFIAADNDLCDVEIDYLLKTIQRARECEFWINSYKSYGGVRATEVPTMEGMETLQYQLLLDGEYFVANFNTKRQAEQASKSLQARCEKDGLDPAKVKLFTRTEGARITNIDEQWGNYFVFFSPIIVTGRDFNPDLPTTTFCYVKGTHSLSPEESVQQLARNRNMKHLYFHLENVAAVTPSFKTEADIKECFRGEREALKGMCVYQEVCDRRVSDCGDACVSRDNVFTDIVSKVELRRHFMKCDFRHHYIKILTKTGFQVEESDKPTMGFGWKKEKILDQLILKERDREIEALIVKIGAGVPPIPTDDVFETDARHRAEMLHLPLEEQVIREYKDEVFDDKAFQRHLNVRRLAQSEETSAKILKAAMEGDVSLDATQTDATRVAILRYLLTTCVPDCSSLLQLQVSVGSKDEVSIPEGALGRWEVLNGFRKGDTRQIPNNKRKLIHSLVDTAKKLFGDDFVTTTYPQQRRDGKKHNETCYTVNPKWRERHMNLFRHSAYTQEGKLDIEVARLYRLRRVRTATERKEQERLQKMRSIYKRLGIVYDS